MGASRIQGITVEIGGDTTKLTAALKGVNGEIRTTQSQQRKCLKASLVMRHRPDLLGELMDLEPPEGEDVEALKAFWEQVQEREKMAAEIADDIFPVDFHIYAIKCPENCMMQIGVETVWQVIDGSFSGDKKTMKQLRKLFKKIYLYLLCYKAADCYHPNPLDRQQVIYIWDLLQLFFYPPEQFLHS